MKRVTPVVLLLFVASAAIGVFAQNAIPVGVFHDDGQYLILARSIAEHATYRFDNLPGSPPGLHYPPGYPALLSVLWLIAPGNMQVFKLANALLLGVAALSVFWFSRRVFGLSERAAAAVGLVVVASAPFVWVNSMLISETLFVAMLYATFAMNAGRRDGNTRWQLGVGALAGATALVRSLADPLAPLLALSRLVRGRRRDALLVIAAWMVLVVPWKLWLRAHAHDMPAPLAGAYGEYSAWWRAAIDAHGTGFVWDTFRTNLSQLGVTLSFFGWSSLPVLRWLAIAIVVALAVAGAWAARRSAMVVGAYALIYAAIVLAWPYEPDRFLWMLAPAIAAAVAVGVTIIYRTVRATRGAPAWCAAVAALVVAVGLAQTHIAVYRTRPWERGLGDRGEKGKAAARLASTLPEDARIASDFDEIVHLRTGRIAVPARGLTAAEYVHPVSDSLAAARLDTAFVLFRITHVIVADQPTLAAVQWLRSHGAALTPVASDSGGAVVFARNLPAQAFGAMNAPPTRPVRK